MPDDGAGIQLTALGASESVDESRLADFYTYPDNPRSCWVRGNMIASLDGGATADGKSGGLAGKGDRAVFSQMRHAADVILVGASTVRVENYSGVQLPVGARQARQGRGQAEVPPIAVVTRSGDLDPSALLFTRTEVPPLILTSARTVEETRRRLGAVAEVIDTSGTDPDSADSAVILRVLAERGLFRVLAEGGPLFLGSLIENGLMDELCLTVAPVLVGGASKRIVTGIGHAHTKMRRAHLLADDDGYLYTRYVRAD
jgi:riboflavin biosynthesis pyrimidine reductase